MSAWYFRVHHHERACLRSDLHRPEERLVIDHQRALVGHEELVGGDPFLREGGQLLERAAVLQISDRHVVAHVDHLPAFGLRFPLLDGGGECVPLRLDDEVDVTGRASERRRRLSRFDVVDRHGSAERHVEMRMRIDAAGKHVLPGCVDHLVRGEVE